MECAGFIIKIDIEGFEVDLFRENTEWISLFPIFVADFVVYIFPWSGTAIAVLASVLGRGRYDFIQNGENCFWYAHSKLKPSPSSAGEEL
jgi:hypothetical protein